MWHMLCNLECEHNLKEMKTTIINMLHVKIRYLHIVFSTGDQKWLAQNNDSDWKRTKYLGTQCSLHFQDNIIIHYMLYMYINWQM